VANVLVVATLELRNPVLLLILVETNDFPVHGAHGERRLLQGPQRSTSVYE